MCCSSVLLGFQRELGESAGLFLQHLLLSRGGNGKPAGSKGWQNLTALHGGCMELGGCATWHQEGRSLRRALGAHSVKGMLFAIGDGPESIQVVVEVNCVVTGILKVWVKPST